ncbi:MAG: tetratricopeptide repeat protein, partial [Anaerolineae bacterium]|nr:tetratricopeptide repeat protein [Anaerolineae bacterium]
HPDEIQLRQRLAQVYQHQGRTTDAVAQLDALGEMLLDAGDYATAAQTIRKIISMNPPDVAQYQELLEQINASAGGSISG